MKIDKKKHVQFLKRKIRELNQLFFYELRQGHSSLQKLRDISYVIGTLKKEVRDLKNNMQQYF